MAATSLLPDGARRGVTNKSVPSREEILEAIRNIANTTGRCPSRDQFRTSFSSHFSQIHLHFASWREALRAAGVEAGSTNQRLDDKSLINDWAEVVRKNREIPTRDQYRRHGKFSATSFEKHFGPWSMLPEVFRKYAQGRSEWADVLAYLPPPSNAAVIPIQETHIGANDESSPDISCTHPQHMRLTGRPTYGNPIDFRGLRHEPVNENGVVFLFGIVARELGYSVEAVQAGFPDCEAKRQVASGKWQRVSIEFEYESRNFRDHNHPQDGCDVIVCWRHNWRDCPTSIEVVELCTVIKQLAKSDE